MENMINFTQDASTTDNQMKTVIKQKMVEFFINTLTEQFGEENVHMLRTGTNSLTNEIGFKVSLTDSDGFPQDVVVTIDPKLRTGLKLFVLNSLFRLSTLKKLLLLMTIT